MQINIAFGINDNYIQHCCCTIASINNYHKTAQNPAIVHYITNIKPWTPGNNVYMKNEYFKYLKLTPFYKDFVIDFLLTENSILINKLDKISGNINDI